MYPNLKNQIYALIQFSVLHYDSFTYGALSLSKQCGDHICEGHTYCDAVDHSCRQCSTVCDPDGHNFDQERCEQSCQDHLHDGMYVKKEMFEELKEDILVLKIILAIVLFISVIGLAILVTFFVYFWRKMQPPSFKKKKQMELPTIFKPTLTSTPTPSVAIPTRTAVSSDGGTAATRSELDSVSTTPAKSEFSTVMTSVSNANSSSREAGPGGKNGTLVQRYRREPSESTLPDYVYENSNFTNNTNISSHV